MTYQDLIAENAAIFCKGLTRHYGEVKALESLDLKVPEGSIFGYLGRNGAGKTTTIRLLTGLAHPTSGSAWVKGVEVTNGDSSARESFGYLPQDPAFYGWMSAVEYLDYIGSIYKLSKSVRKDRIEEMLNLVDLSGAAYRRISGYSGGMKQRLGIAQALFHKPAVLFLDEPTSALDPAGRYEILDMIASLRGKVTVFFSSHILADVERICDHIAVIHNGRLIVQAGRDELLSRYSVNAVALEFDHASQEILDTFLVRLKEESWIEKVTQDQMALHILVSDVEQAKLNLLPIVLQSGLVLNRYEWVHPSLEEIFLEVSR